MSWKSFLTQKIAQRDLTNGQVYITILVAFLVGLIIG
jgi:hypothetical protein